MTRFANLTPNANRTIWVLLPKVISPCLTRVYDRCKRLVVITPTNCPVSHTNHFRQSVSQFRRLQYLIKKSIYRLWSGLALARLFYVCLFYVCLFYARLFYVCLFYVCLFYVCLFYARLFYVCLFYVCLFYVCLFSKVSESFGRGGRFRAESQWSIES